MKTLKQERPEIFKAFMSLAQTINSRDVLPDKTKELIKLSACVAQGSSFGVGVHVRKVIEYGATKDEIIDTIICCLPVVGIPLMNQALEAAMGTIETILREKQVK